MRQGQVGRADLLRAFDSDGSPFQEQLARHLGFDVEEVVELSLEPTVEFRAAPATASKQVSDETLPAPVSQLFKPEPMWFWLPESISPRGNVEVEIEDGSVQGFEVSPRSEPRVTESLRFEPLASTSSVLFRLRQLAELQQPGHRPDLNRIVRIISDGRTLSRIPRQTKKTWGAQLSVIVDLSRHLIPYRHDWRHFRDALSRHLSNTELTIAELPDGLCRPVIRTPVGRRGEECAPPAETVVIAVVLRKTSTLRGIVSRSTGSGPSVSSAVVDDPAVGARGSGIRPYDACRISGRIAAFNELSVARGSD